VERKGNLLHDPVRGMPHGERRIKNESQRRINEAGINKKTKVQDSIPATGRSGAYKKTK